MQEFKDTLRKAADLAIHHNQASVPFFQRKLNMSYLKAEIVCTALEGYGAIRQTETREYEVNHEVAKQLFK
jgi:hypothetical protein